MTEPAGGTHPSDVPEITAGELKERMDRDEPLVIVDVREAHERAIADLPGYGQLHIPVGEIEGRMDEVDPESEVVCYCRSGARSAWAVSRLLDSGYQRVWNLRGGVLAWREEVDPSLTAY